MFCIFVFFLFLFLIKMTLKLLKFYEFCLYCLFMKTFFQVINQNKNPTAHETQLSCSWNKKKKPNAYTSIQFIIWLVAVSNISSVHSLLKMIYLLHHRKKLSQLVIFKFVSNNRVSEFSNFPICCFISWCCTYCSHEIFFWTNVPSSSEENTPNFNFFIFTSVSKQKDFQGF